MMNRPLELQIDELVLEQFAHFDALELQNEIAAALQRLIDQQGLPEHLRHASSLEEITVIEDRWATRSASDLANNIAEAIYNDPSKKTK
jgi:hypothetical protein